MSTRQQDLIEKLIIEAIKQRGIDVYYIPRNTVDIDYIFGEDVLSQFRTAIEIEMYIKDVSGFAGDGRFVSQMGIEIRDAITLCLSVKRFKQARDEQLNMESNFNLQLESANTNMFDNFDTNISLESDNYQVTKAEPERGDLIYVPVFNKLFEIKDVQQENLFYQFGKLMLYELACEVFEYSHEKIDTGVTTIDDIEDLFSGDQRFFNVLQEDNTNLLFEEGGQLILEDYEAHDYNPWANNAVFAQETDDIIDFSQRNPFIGTTRW